jgi:predicted MPP superfamily phosphohydrolase
MPPFLAIAIFLALALGVLFGVQFFLYVSIVRFFSIIDMANRLAVYVSTAFMPISFISASVLAALKENAFTKNFYVLSGVLLGIGANLFLASLAAWITIWALSFTSFLIPKPVIAGTYFFVAVIVSLYGVWNTSHPIVKRIDVTIPGLSDAWKGKRIVQLSDIHLGYVYQPEFMRRVASQVDALHPELVVITGDLFDGMDGELERSLDPLNDIRARKGIFFVNGNHETYFGLEKSFALLEKTSIRVLKDEVVDVDGLKIIGIGYPDRGEKKDVVGIVRALGSEWKGSPNILLYHSPTHIRGFKDAGVHLQLSGHTHKGQMFPFNLITKLVYNGHDYGLHRDGDYTLYTTNGVGTWGPSMRIGNRPEIVEITLQ